MDLESARAGQGAWTPPSELDPSVALAELNASEDGLIWVDRMGRVVFINEAAHDLFGRILPGEHIRECAERYQVLRPDGSTYPTEERPLFRSAIRRERVRSERCRIQRPDGSVVDVTADATPLEDADGQAAGTVLRVKNVTQREALARAVRLGERRFKALVAATAQMIWVTDREGLVREPSPSWEAFTGQPHEKWLGYGWLDVVHPDDRERTRAVWLRAVEQRRPYEVEYRVRRRDGVYRWTVARGAPIVGDDGEIHEWVGCNWDIHPLKEAEEEQARAAQLLRMLLAVIGHDLRNPLSSVLVGAALLQRSAVDSATRTVAARITRGAERATSILDFLLDLTAAELGGIQLRYADTDLAELASEIVAEFEGQVAGRAISVAGEGETSGRFDRTRMGQVISNLVSNAIHHGTPGTSVCVNVRREDDVLCLQVENRAPRIPDEKIAQLFRPFIQGEQLPVEGRKNLGLGLYIVDQIVKAHGGSVAADSTDERTVLTVRIPRSAPGAVDPAPLG